MIIQDTNLLNFLIIWIDNIKMKYNVNPYIFAAIYCISVIPFWFSIYKIVINIKNRQTAAAIKWGIILGILILAPFIYVAIFGRNLPFWFWLVVAFIIIFSVISLIRNIRQRV